MDEENKVEETIDYKDKYIRALAELDNYRKQKENQIANLVKYANKDILLELVNIYETLEHLDNCVDSTTLPYEEIIPGYKEVSEQIKRILEKNEVSQIDTNHVDFNENLHEAVSTDSIENTEDNVVVYTLQNGYTYKDKVLRYAKVVVNKK